MPQDPEKQKDKDEPEEPVETPIAPIDIRRMHPRDRHMLMKQNRMVGPPGRMSPEDRKNMMMSKQVQHTSGKQNPHGSRAAILAKKNKPKE